MRQSLYDDGVFQAGCTVDGVDASGATKKFQADEVLEFIEENGTFFASQNLLGEAYSDFSLEADDTQEDFNTAVYEKFQDVGDGYSFTEYYLSGSGDDELTVAAVKIGRLVILTFVLDGGTSNTFTADAAVTGLIPAGNSAIEAIINNPGDAPVEASVSSAGLLSVTTQDGSPTCSISYVSHNSTKLT